MHRGVQTPWVCSGTPWLSHPATLAPSNKDRRNGNAGEDGSRLCRQPHGSVHRAKMQDEFRCPPSLRSHSQLSAQGQSLLCKAQPVGTSVFTHPAHTVQPGCV